MCGIAGLVSPRPIPDQILPAFLKALRHRGPDDEGVFLNQNHQVGLAHTRLSILDLSPMGHQPMTNETGKIWITYNGEIYNYRELREELSAKGHRFTSQTDTEVILHLYEEEKEALTQRLTGMFAFAIYDEPRNCLFLARDRLGIKPLYFAEHRGTFLFASEIKGLLATGLIPAEVNWQSIRDYFTFGFIPHPATAFSVIQQLPPAHTLHFEISSGTFLLNRYWTPWSTVGRLEKFSPQQIREEIRRVLIDAVCGELVSDVPLGLFFSGGIDSTLLAAIMSRHSQGKVKTFTIGFKGIGFESNSDISYARLASKTLGTEHHELFVELNHPEELLDVVRVVDQPFLNPTLYLQYLIAKVTRQEVTVALSGAGADELFGGYPKYRLFPIAPVLQAIPRGIGTAGAVLLRPFHEKLWGPILRRSRRLLRGVGFDLPEQYIRWSYLLSELEKDRLLAGPLRSAQLLPAVRIIQEALAVAPPGTNRYGRLLHAELRTFLTDNLLEYTDKATMAVALETRVPYLNHRLVELAARIPFHQKIRAGRSKAILIDAFSDLIPESIAHAPKRGFSAPLAQWMETTLDKMFDVFLSKKQVAADGLFQWDAIQTWRAQRRTGYRDTSMELLAILMLSAWYRHYILSRSLG